MFDEITLEIPTVPSVPSVVIVPSAARFPAVSPNKLVGNLRARRSSKNYQQHDCRKP